MAKNNQAPAQAVDGADVAGETENVAAQEVDAGIGDSQSAPPIAMVVSAPPDGVTHRISAAPDRGIWRAGRHWPRGGVAVYRGDFSADQWAALNAEPLLSVTLL